MSQESKSKEAQQILQNFVESDRGEEARLVFQQQLIQLANQSKQEVVCHEHD